LPADDYIPTNKKKHIRAQGENDDLDTDGNLRQCPDGTVPVIRYTLEKICKNFKSVEQWDSKYPDDESDSGTEASEKRSALNSHRYAVGYQNVNNHGGHSTLNVWQPVPIASNAFSLSQVWYAGGTPTQTVEVGWQVYQQLYGTTKPCLFIYYTPDGYATGCYNNGCGKFVQYSTVWIPGGQLGPVSTMGGTQQEIEIVVLLSNGNWWVMINNQWLGYYPLSLYGTGQLKTYATLAEYGGEVTANAAGTTGQMGSGKKAAAGFQNAAYQKNIFYYDTTAASNSNWATLSPIISCPSDYTINIANGGSGTQFYYGGQSSQAANCN